MKAFTRHDRKEIFNASAQRKCVSRASTFQYVHISPFGVASDTFGDAMPVQEGGMELPHVDAVCSTSKLEVVQALVLLRPPPTYNTNSSSVYPMNTFTSSRLAITVVLSNMRRQLALQQDFHSLIGAPHSHGYSEYSSAASSFFISPISTAICFHSSLVLYLWFSAVLREAETMRSVSCIIPLFLPS